MAATPVWDDDFETNADDRWLADGVAWRTGVPDAGVLLMLAGGRVHSGMHCAGVGMTAGYPQDSDARLILEIPIRVPAASEFPRLRFWQAFWLGSGDNGSVEVRRVDRDAWEEVSPMVTGNGGGVWSPSVISLAAYAGETVQIAFRFTSDGVFRGGDTGWLVDDVALLTGVPVFPDPEGFEDGFGDWHADGGVWEVGTMGLLSPYSGEQGAGVGLTAGYPANVNSRLISPPFLVPATADLPRLRFYHRYAIAAGDRGGVEVRPSGSAVWQQLSPDYRGSSGGLWSQASVSLAAYGGTQMEIAFHFQSDEDFLTTDWGWEIDEVRVVSSPSVLPGNPDDPQVEFRFGQTTVSVAENWGAARVTVLKTGTQAGSVGYTFNPISAVPGGDFVLTPERLDFTPAEASKEIEITLLDDFIIDGPKELAISLKDESSNGVIGTPGTVRLVINDDEPALTPTLFARVQHPGRRSEVGSLRVFLDPSSLARGGWRLPWELIWHPSGHILENLDVGNYPVDFRPVPSYQRPPALFVPILNATTPTVRTAVYRPDKTNASGSLQVLMDPAPSGAGWRLRGDSDFLAGGQQLDVLSVSTNILEFRPVSGWIAPPARLVVILPNLNNRVVASYQPAPPLPAGTRVPVPVPQLSEIEGALTEGTLHRPLPFLGQLRSSAGLGSGIAVGKKVVLTAAHVLFDDKTTNFVGSIEWFAALHAGEYESRPIRARGWYTFEQYGLERRKEREQGLRAGVSTRASQQWDVAAIYFNEPVARDGESGFLLSDSDEWILSNQDSLLGGYPLTGGDGDGRLHVTESRPYRFAEEGPRLFSTSGFVSYPGNSGGPWCVLADPVTNRFFYPAAVYLGTFEGRSLVRAIDSDVARLIARAASSAELGTNFTGGGVVSFTAASGERLGIQRLAVTLEPKEASDQGAGWRLAGSTNAFFDASEAFADLLVDVDYTIEFKPVPGWITPNPFSIRLRDGQDAELNVTYHRAAPVLIVSGEGIFVSGATDRIVEIEFAPHLGTSIPWAKLRTITLGAAPVRIAGPPWPSVAAGFYRARWGE